MRRLGNSAARVSAPLRVWVQRFTFLMMLAASAALILAGRNETAVVEQVRAGIADRAADLLAFVARPVGLASEMVETVNELAVLRAENERLRDENQRLLQWEAVAHRVQAENRAFRSMLNFVPEQPYRYISARVIVDSSGAFARSMLLAAGDEHGIRKGQAVIGGQGLVGRVVEVGDRTARVLLLSDLNSRIPVRLEASRDRAILSGDNTDRPRLMFLPRDATVAPDDRVVTSGDGGVFPAGLAIGRVAESEDKEVRVELFAERGRLEFVRVIDRAPVGIVGEGSWSAPGGGQ